MKKNVVFVALLVMVLSVSTVFAQEETKSPWDFSIVTDFAYYPKSAPVATSETGSQFAPITGAMSAVEARVTGFAGYTIPTPFGDNPLVSGNRVKITGIFELSPVSIDPAIQVQFSPIAFLDFTAGASIAAGWPLSLGDDFNVPGIAEWNPVTEEYDDLIFNAARIEAWFQGLFQFDLAAIIPGEWNHVVTMNTYKVYYEGVTGLANGQPYNYQGSGGKVNGWKYNATFLLGYQMPLVLQTVAVQAELDGYLDGEAAYAKEYHSIDPDFMTVYIAPVAILEFTEKDALTIQARFASRPSYTTTYKSSADRLNGTLVPVGREWFFDRIALSYKHSF